MKGKRNKRTFKRKIAWDLSLLRQLLVDYPARQWKNRIDGNNISGRYLLWEAMNIPSVGPGLDLAPQAATDDGQLDFVGVREQDRWLLKKHLDARLAGKKSKFSLPSRKFRKLKVTSRAMVTHVDGKPWPTKKKKRKGLNAVEITAEPGALIVWQPRYSGA